MMIDPETGKTHTSHTTLPVPFVLENSNSNDQLLKEGKLADIAPTILEYLQVPIPTQMTGKSLFYSTDV